MYLQCPKSKVILIPAAAFLLVAVTASIGGSVAMAQSSWYGSASLPYEPQSQALPLNVAVSQIFPGGGAPSPIGPIAKQYEGNPTYINDGHRLFLWYNCVGCHSNGGGGMGPALMDNQWRYGGRIDQIFASIYQGRPNGMPSWGGKMSNGEIWELAAFIKSLSSPSGVQPESLPGEAIPTPPPPEAGEPRAPTTAAPNAVQKPGR